MATVVGKIAEVAGLDKCSKGHDGYEHQGYGYSCRTCGQRLYRWVPGTTRVNLIGAAQEERNKVDNTEGCWECRFIARALKGGQN